MNSGKCVRCTKTCYPNERVAGIDLFYHKLCFKCSHDKCKVTLTSRNYQKHSGQVWCKNHTPKGPSKVKKEPPAKKETAKTVKLSGKNADVVENVTDIQRDVIRDTEGKCAECNSEIFGATLFAAHCIFHENCFCCTTCGTRLNEGTEFSFDEDQEIVKPCCIPCTPKHACVICGVDVAAHDPLCRKLDDTKHVHVNCHKCSVCGTDFPDGNYYKTEDWIMFCEEHRPVVTTETCKICSTDIDVGTEVVKAGDDKFHDACFKCISCKRPLGGCKYFMEEESLSCESCYRKKNAKVCSKCNVDLVPPTVSLNVGGNTICLPCMACCECKKVPDVQNGDEVYFRGDDAICGMCAGV